MVAKVGYGHSFFVLLSSIHIYIQKRILSTKHIRVSKRDGRILQTHLRKSGSTLHLNTYPTDSYRFIQAPSHQP